MKLLLIIIGLYSISSYGGVNLKNGNFYINYTDVIVSGSGPELSVVRTYNSKSTHKGWFGFGWGSDFETKLEVSPDGSVTIFENGSGARTRFTPKGSNDPSQGVDKIISKMKSRANISDVVAENLRERLLGDSELRLAYARKFKVVADIKTGDVLYSSLRGSQKLMKTSRGYKRFYESGKFEEFDLEGYLKLVQQKDGHKVFLNYKDNRLTSIKDTKSKQLFFEWYESGRVKSISTGSKTKSSYEYDSDNLISSTDMAGNTYKFEYDSYHNMKKVKYADGKEMTIAYEPQTQFVT
ncbi:MAG: RHS repeat protein, partial [Bdellovibrionales bacterium]|nr:RHS repeat protein [Bdellovibrionales bacterium]